MSKNNNVNPGQYKVAGRERPGEDIQQAQEKQRLTQSRQRVQETGSARKQATAHDGSPKGTKAKRGAR